MDGWRWGKGDDGWIERWIELVLKSEFSGTIVQNILPDIRKQEAESGCLATVHRWCYGGGVVVGVGV